MFIQQNLALSFNQSRFAFNVYVYETEDTCAEVLTSGYFDASRFAVTNPVEWKNAIIEVKCSDGFGKGYIDDLGDFQFFIGGLPAAFCDWIDYTEQEIGSGGSSFVRNAIDKQYEVTTVGGDFNGYLFFNFTDGFDSDTSLVSYEVDVILAADPVSGTGVFIFQPTGIPQDPFLIVAAIFNQGGTVVDIISGSPIGAAAFQTGYKMGITFDFNTGQAIGYDNGGNNSALAVDGLYDSGADVNLAWAALSFAAVTNIFSPNSGDRPFSLPQSLGVGFCNVIPPPPPVFCAPVNLVVNAGTPPSGNQDMILSGANNLTVECTSLGNILVDGGGVGSTEVFQTTTQEVKIESTMLKDTTFDVSAPAVCGLLFVKDLYTTPNLIASVIYLPNASGGALIDLVGGQILDTFVGKVLFNEALYLDPTPQQKKYVFQVSPDPVFNGSVDVHGVTTFVTAAEDQVVIAANIVANGFTDPNIESMTISPDDNRDVVITYTVAAGDYPVDVTSINCVIFENPDDSRDFQLAKVRAKYQIVGNPTVQEYQGLAVNVGYSNLDNIYMGSFLDCGDGLGGELDVTMNFGSSAFILGEDAERWCNV